MPLSVEQLAPIRHDGHVAVIAGPGSGKTRVLVAAIALALEEVKWPRSVACITYSKECVRELEQRLSNMGVVNEKGIFVGTVHSFSLTRIIKPFASCVPKFLPQVYRVATESELDSCKRRASQNCPAANIHQALKMRRSSFERSVDWRASDPVSARYIDTYESILRSEGLIDYDDMPLLAYKLLKIDWIRKAVRAWYPRIFVDEYQDLGVVLNSLVELLCLSGERNASRLFAVGDIDQAIYSFTGATPHLFKELALRQDVADFYLYQNYRSGEMIVRASLGALGKEREYLCGESVGEFRFCNIKGDTYAQSQFVVSKLLPDLMNRFPLEKIGILYREAWVGDRLSSELETNAIPYVRCDKKAIIPRSSSLGQFLISCTEWYSLDDESKPLLRDVVRLAYNVFGFDEKDELEESLFEFLTTTPSNSAFEWLLAFSSWSLKWRELDATNGDDWALLDKLLAISNPINGSIPLQSIIPQQEAIQLSTFHSSKGREFDAVILLGMDSGIFPGSFDTSDTKIEEARRLMYVGVTRARFELYCVFNHNNYSPWLPELKKRLNLQAPPA
ncbi:UvrD-helicase domain-containing protein [Enterovibrio calviensis]|uniref:UvrD-helicase domain-containing protein n=1 Tax=Enterovibrio calviensis TaxID=91359 RepID=UPI0037353552